jgi:hypothetical protein
MAAGLPVVATRVGGLLDLIDEGRTGLLVAPDDPAALAAAIESLVLSPARAAMLGAAARDEVTRRYSFDRMVRGFEDLYLAQLHTAGVPAGPRVSSQAALDHVRHRRTFQLRPLRPGDRGVLEAMTDAVAHRGPTPPAITRARHRPRPPAPQHHRSLDRRSAA